MQPRRLLLILTAALTGLLSVPDPTSAVKYPGSDGESHATTHTIVGNGTASVRWDADFTDLTGGPGVVTQQRPLWMQKCDVRTGTLTSIEDELSSREAKPVTLDPTKGDDWAIWACPYTPNTAFIGDATNPAGPANHNGIIGHWARNGQPPNHIMHQLVLAAVAETSVPAQAGLSSPPGDDTLPMITQLDTWLWLDNAHKQPRSATADLYGDGVYTATVTLTPETVTYTGGQTGGYEETITCTMNQLREYLLGNPNLIQNTYCKILYRHRTGESHLQTTIHYTVTGTCSRICTPGYLGEMHATYDRPVTVNEVLIKNN